MEISVYKPSPLFVRCSCKRQNDYLQICVKSDNLSYKHAKKLSRLLKRIVSVYKVDRLADNILKCFYSSVRVKLFIFLLLTTNSNLFNFFRFI